MPSPYKLRWLRAEAHSRSHSIPQQRFAPLMLTVGKISAFENCKPNLAG